jgi:hypothetical protein
MRPGILIEHARLPDRSSALVRGDILGILAFIPQERWPSEASPGDYFELVLRRDADFWAHPHRDLVHPSVRRAVRSFFDNGGDVCRVLGVCITSEEDLRTPPGVHGVLEPLLQHLRAEDEIALLIVPEAAYLRCLVGRDGMVQADCEALYDALLVHCREMSNRFLILDAPRGLHADLLVSWVSRFRDRHPENRSFGAVYYPWLYEGDELFPPSGTVAGLFARVELEHRPFGIVWPPANVPLRAVTHPEVELTWAEAGELSEKHINPIIIQAGRGVLVFGARTLSREPAFLHINSRRVVNMVAEQLRRDNEWAVFEVNNPNLWAVLQRDVRHRLSQFWSAGLLTGSRDGSEYMVRCDAEINPPASRDAGHVNVQVHIRPMGTTEQIRIDLRIGGEARIQQP